MTITVESGENVKVHFVQQFLSDRSIALQKWSPDLESNCFSSDLEIARQGWSS